MANEDFNKRLNDAMRREHLDADGGTPVEASDESSGFGQASSGLASGMRIGVEFLAGTVVGFLLGYGLDRWLDTSPWFLLVFTILGFGAGFMNVYRSINRLDEGIGINRRNVLTKSLETLKKPTD